MTDGELKEIEARSDRAAPGPWFVTDGGRHEHTVSRDMGAGYVSVLFERAWWVPGGAVDTADAEFIVNARADVPALVAEVRLLRQVIEDQQQESGLYDAGFRAGVEAAADRILVKSKEENWYNEFSGFLQADIRSLRQVTKTE